MKHKKIIFITNDFGFGPISRTHTIAEALSRHSSDIEIHIVTNGRSDYLFDQGRIIFDHLNDLRSQTIISEYLAQYDKQETILVSVMNRFALVAAKNLGFTTILVDGLYWFWVNRPKEYDLADYQFRVVLPWQTDQFNDSEGIFYFANPVDVTAESINSKDNLKDNKILFTLNGFMTPFYKQDHDSYLEFSALIANHLGQNDRVTLTGNKNIKDKVSKYLDQKISFETLSKSSYLSQLKSAKYVLLNGGSNSFTEALLFSKNFIFSLPSNQSQYALISEVAKYTKTAVTDWCPLLGLFANPEKILEFNNEGEAIDYWSKEIRHLLDNDAALAHMNKLLDQLPEKLSLIDSYSEELRVFAENSKESTNRVAKTVMDLIGSA